jgi:hypothetical protein
MSENTTRPVNEINPSHYREDSRDAFPDAREGEECIDYINRTRGVLAAANFCGCSAIKYKWRAGKKDGAKMGEDRAKAKWYDDMRHHLLSPNEYPDPRKKEPA